MMNKKKEEERRKKKEEEWSWYALKYDLVEFIIPKLERYKREFQKEGVTIPNWVLKKEEEITEEVLIAKWIEELDLMINAFEQILNYTTGNDERMDYDEAFIQRGLNKFAQYFQHFWD